MAYDRCNVLQSPCRCIWSKRWQSGDCTLKRGLNTKIHLAVDEIGMPLRVIITEGTRNDCTQACALIEGFKGGYLIADRAYDSDRILKQVATHGMEVVIPPRKNRKYQRPYNEELYKFRHIVENTFLKLKKWRGIATRYAKNAASFLAAVQVRCIAIWTEFLSRVHSL